jgi:hypothetical protein
VFWSLESSGCACFQICIKVLPWRLYLPHETLFSIKYSSNMRLVVGLRVRNNETGALEIRITGKDLIEHLLQTIYANFSWPNKFDHCCEILRK